MSRAYNLEPRSAGIFYRRPSGAYVTVCDGQVWEWTLGRGKWANHQLENFPADAVYASRQVPAALVERVLSMRCELWTYDLARGQEHAQEKTR